MNRRKPWFLALFQPYVRRKLARELDGVWVRGLYRTADFVHSQPVIYAANHVAWWDPLLAIALDQAMKTEAFGIMDEHNLRKLPFFRWVGAVGIDRSEPGSAGPGLKACAELLDRPGRALWIFPQGKQRPSHLQPLDFKTGVLRLQEMAAVPIIPVSIRYLFGERATPQVWIDFGEPLMEADIKTIETHVIDGLARIDYAFEHSLDEFEPLVSGSFRRSEKWLGTQALIRLAGDDEK